jgi:hypothetical protein
MPQMALDAGRGLVDLLAGVRTGQMSPEATQAIAGLATSSAMQPPQQGLLAAIKAYHGSPHRFDKFDMSKIGTGEGAQAYGHGLYFAENPEVARGYASMTSDAVADAFNELADDYGNLGLPRADGKGQALYRSPDGVRNAIARGDLRLEDVPSGLREHVAREPSHYTVDLDVEPEDLLDWDAPLSQQSEKVRGALEGLGWGKLEQRSLDEGWTSAEKLGDQSGGDIYGHARYALQPEYTTADAWAGTAADVSSALRAAGIPGLKYWDGGSRASGEGTRNFVLFDDTLAKILERNGQPVK